MELTWPIAVLSAIAGVLWLYTALLGGWQVYMALAGLRKKKNFSRNEEHIHRFAVVVCARNEEAVIGHLVDSLHQQEYPSDCFDVVVVADNCTDDTARVARDHGAYVYERSDTERVGKGFALRWIFDKLLHEVPTYYDAFAVFDADNVVDNAFLHHMNEALCAGADIAQGFRESKNPFDSVVSGCYTVYWYMLSRFYHEVRTNRGLPCSVGGTGFAFKRRVIETTGWNTETLTEDSEFASRKILEGFHVRFVRDAITYDEQPISWRMSFVQRMRWMCGLMQESRLLTKPAYRAWRQGNKDAFDVLMFMLGVPAIAIVLLASALSLTVAVLLAMKLWEQWYIVLGAALLILLGTLYVVTFLLAILSVKMEKGKVTPYWKTAFVYPIFLAPMALFTLISFFKTNCEWEPVAHVIRVTLEDIKRKR